MTADFAKRDSAGECLHDWNSWPGRSLANSLSPQERLVTQGLTVRIFESLKINCLCPGARLPPCRGARLPPSFKMINWPRRQIATGRSSSQVDSARPREPPGPGVNSKLTQSRLCTSMRTVLSPSELVCRRAVALGPAKPGLGKLRLTSSGPQRLGPPGKFEIIEPAGARKPASGVTRHR